MKHLLLLFFLSLGLTLNAQVETEVTTLLNIVCEDPACAGIQLGACPEDLDSEGQPLPDSQTQFQVYYVTENVILNSPSLTLRNCRLEFRNGANLVDNGIVVDEQTECDFENTTEIVFIGGGQQFGSVEEMNQTLGINEVDRFYEVANKIYYDLLGKQHKNLDYVSKGIYIVKYSLNGRAETKKIIKS